MMTRFVSTLFLLFFAFAGTAWAEVPVQDSPAAVVPNALPDARLDLNTATVEQLEGLPGIGKKKAEAIVADRTANGPYGSVQDLGRVKGIGKATLAKLEPLTRAVVPEGVTPKAAEPKKGKAPKAKDNPEVTP